MRLIQWGDTTQRLFQVTIIGLSFFGSHATADDDSDFLDALDKATSGDVEAQVTLAEYYEKGRGTKINTEKTFEWLSKASEAGNARAKAVLSAYYDQGKHCERDRERSLSLINESAEAGDGLGATLLGRWYYLLGQHEENETKIKEGAELIQKMAEMKVPEAMTYVASLHLGGNEPWFEQDFDIARLYLTKAADLGDTRAMIQLSTFYLASNTGVADPAKSEEWLQRAVDVGDVNAIEQMGLIKQGRHNDPKAAMELYEKAIAKGHLGSILRKAVLYSKGQGVEKDLVMARKLTQEAADKGFQEARVALGQMKLNGYGGIQNKQAGLDLLRETAEEGNIKACLELGAIYIKGDKVDRNINEGLKWLRKSAELGDHKSQLYLSQFLSSHFGKIIKEDPSNDEAINGLAEAYQWAAILGEKGHVQSMFIAAATAPIMAIKERRDLPPDDTPEEEKEWARENLAFGYESPQRLVTKKYERLKEEWLAKAAAAGKSSPSSGAADSAGAALLLASKKFDTLMDDMSFSRAWSGNDKSVDPLGFKWNYEKQIEEILGLLKPALDKESPSIEAKTLNGKLMEAKFIAALNEEESEKLANKVNEIYVEIVSEDDGDMLILVNGTERIARHYHNRGNLEESLEWYRYILEDLGVTGAKPLVDNIKKEIAEAKAKEEAQ